MKIVLYQSRVLSIFLQRGVLYLEFHIFTERCPLFRVPYVYGGVLYLEFNIFTERGVLYLEFHIFTEVSFI